MDDQQSLHFTPGWNDPPTNVQITASHKLQRQKRPVDPSIQNYSGVNAGNNYYQQQSQQLIQQQNYQLSQQQSYMRPQSVPQQSYMNSQSVPQQHTSAQQYYDHQQVNQPQVSPQAYPNAAVNEQSFHQGPPNNPYFNPQSAQQVYHPQQPSAFSPVQPNSRQL